MSRETILDEAIIEAKAAGDWQLAEWLRMARGSYKGDRWFMQKIDQLKAENEQLRKERDHWHVEQVHAYGNWEDTRKYAVEVETQNAELHELVIDMWHELNAATQYDAGGARGIVFEYLNRMRELGIEVDE